MLRTDGGNWIKSKRCSPDAFIQIAMQMAYFTLYGDFAPTYEAVMTKYFFHGRTEAGRSCTAEFCAFARLFHSASATAEEKHEAFQKAAMAHVAMCKDCGSGKGVDRHLFALRAMATMHGVEMPALFSTQAWTHLNTTLLSTSNCGNPSLRMFGFGPVSPQGFGIGYIYKADAIAFCVTSKHRQTPRYVHTLENYLHDIRELLNAIRPEKPFMVRAMSQTGSEPEPEPEPARKADEDDDGYGDFFGTASLARQRTLKRTGSEVALLSQSMQDKTEAWKSRSLASTSSVDTRISGRESDRDSAAAKVATASGPPTLDTALDDRRAGPP